MCGFRDMPVPKQRIKNSGNKPKFPLWCSMDLISRIREYEVTSHYLEKQASPPLCSYFNNLNSIKQKTKYKAYQKNIESNLDSDLSSFCQFLCGKSKTSGKPAEIRNDKILYSSTKHIANAFAQHFQSVYEKPTKIEDRTPDFSGRFFKFSVISEINVINSIKKLKPKKSTDPDNIPAYILYKGVAEFIALPLKHIFNLAIKHKKFPEALKTGQITPIFKSGSKNEIKNYRPVSLINVLAKIFDPFYLMICIVS